jgi:Domain of unknown function (DUF4962)/Heparinase II/III-like protein
MFIVALLMGFAVYNCPADTKQDWDKFDPPAMTIVFPEKISLSNPPWLVWQPSPEAVKYRVSLSGAGECGPWTLDRTFFLPEEFLTPGVYQMKVQALDESGKALGQVSEMGFQVPEPTGDECPQLNKITRNAKATLLAKKGYLEKVKDATGFRGKLRDELLDYASKPDEMLEYPIICPGRYKEGVWDFDTWIVNKRLSERVEKRFSILMVAWEITGEQKYFDEALKIAKAIASWDPVGATGVWENDHSAQAYLYTSAIFYDIAREKLGKEDRELIRNSIRARCADAYGMLNPMVPRETSSGLMNDPNNNHPWFTAVSFNMGALALLDEEPMAEEWLAYGTQVFWGLFFTKGGRDGGWHEGIDYMNYTAFFVLQLSVALKNNTNVDLFQHPWVQKTPFFKMYAHPPVGTYVPFGDCQHFNPNSFDALVVGSFATAQKDPLGHKYYEAVMEGKEYENILDAMYSLLWVDTTTSEGKSIPEIPFVEHFRDIGWVISNTDLFNVENQIIFALRCGRFFGHSFGHSHADLNSYIITAGGEKLLWDGGYYAVYLGPHHRNYSRLSVAHNTLLIDGVGQVVHTAGSNGEITNFEVDGDVVKVTGDASKPFIYGGRHYKFTRDIEYRNKSEWTVKDDIRLREKAHLSLMFHSMYPIIYTPGDQTILIRGEKWQLEGRIESEVPVTAHITDSFEDEPEPLPRRQVYDKQYQLEIRTAKKVDEFWKPVTHWKLSKIED